MTGSARLRTRDGPRGRRRRAPPTRRRRRVVRTVRKRARDKSLKDENGGGTSKHRCRNDGPVASLLASAFDGVGVAEDATCLPCRRPRRERSRRSRPFARQPGTVGPQPEGDAPVTSSTMNAGPPADVPSSSSADREGGHRRSPAGELLSTTTRTPRRAPRSGWPRRTCGSRDTERRTRSRQAGDGFGGADDGIRTRDPHLGKGIPCVLRRPGVSYSVRSRW
jgi:hypothetical protein